MKGKRNGLFKKIAAVTLLSVMIVMNMAMTVLADNETVDATKTVSLTVIKYEAETGDSTGLSSSVTGVQQTITGKTPIEGVDFTVLKVATLEQKISNGTVGIYYRLTTDGASVLGTGFTAGQDYTITQLNAFVTGKKATDSAFAGLTSITSAVTGTTDENGQVKFTSETVTETDSLKHIDGQGLYLVVETHAPNTVTERTSPFFVSLPMTDRTDFNKWQYDVYAYPKNKTGEIEFDKKISAVNSNVTIGDDNIATGQKSAEANIGDIITFQIPFTMVVPSDGLTKWNIVDTMSKGLTFKKAGSTAASSDVTVRSVATDGTKTAVATANYTVTETKNATTGVTTVTIAFTTAYLNTLNSATDKTPEFEVEYKAVLNEKAVLGTGGNSNAAQAFYRDGSMEDDTEDDKTDEKKTKVYTWGVALTKTGEGSDSMAGVEFKLTDDDDNAYTFKKITDGANSYYVFAGASETGATTTLATDANGKLVIRGLKSGTYDLIETKAASGYVLLKQPLTIVIDGDNTDGSATATVNGTAVTMTKDTLYTGSPDSLSALVPVTVANSKGLFLLPSTGGTGTAMITMIGIMLVIISSVLLIRMGVKKRREASKN